MRPGVNIAIREIPPSRGATTDTGVWFVAGLSEKGPTDMALPVTSLSEFVRYYGEWVSYGYLYDAMDVFFREGGGKAYVSRVVGPGAIKALKVLNDAVAAATLRVEANAPGEWGNALNVEVVAGGAGGTFILVISHDTLGELERSGDLLDKAAALEWAANSLYIDLVDLGTSLLDPAVIAVQSLATGIDDRANIVDAQWTASLTKFTRDLGPGQVSMPGRTVSAAYSALLTHAGANNRVAILDAVNTNTLATLQTAVIALHGGNGRWGAMFGPWLMVPGRVPSTTRTIPPSPVVAGLIARADAIGGSPNTPAAGENGQAVFASALSIAQLSDADRETLNAKGFNAIITKYGVVRVYGWRSLANPTSEANWVNFANSRLVMEIAAQADEIGERYLFDEIDGQGRKIAAFGGDLTGMLMPYWAIGSLYGFTPDEAFLVDVGPSVNTPTTIENRELRAVIGLKASPYAEMITIELVKSQITQTV